MSNNLGKLLHGMKPQAQSPVIQQVTPVNDVQVLALMATMLPGTPAERVRLAVQIVGEAVAQSDTIGQAILTARAKYQAQAPGG